MFNVESSEELKVIDRVAGKLDVKAPVALRINPDVDPETHPHISTGLRKNKFGIPISEAIESYQIARKLPHIEIVGIHKHIGSQLTRLSPFVDALRKILFLIKELKFQGFPIRYIDIGGGLGITYSDEEPPHPKEFAKALIPLLKGIDATLIIEPGRVIVGNAGILVTKVLYIKKTPEKNFVIVDAGMNDLLRPSFYSAYHRIIPVVKKVRKTMTSDIVGPICESADFLAREREIRVPKPNELLAVMSAGAYGFTMSSNYNSRPRVPEVLVKGKRLYVIREREIYNDLIEKERIPKFLL